LDVVVSEKNGLDPASKSMVNRLDFGQELQTSPPTLLADKMDADWRV
jgi:hypothetical protein